MSISLPTRRPLWKPAEFQTIAHGVQLASLRSLAFGLLSGCALVALIVIGMPLMMPDVEPSRLLYLLLGAAGVFFPFAVLMTVQSIRDRKQAPEPTCPHCECSLIRQNWFGRLSRKHTDLLTSLRCPQCNRQVLEATSK